MPRVRRVSLASPGYARRRRGRGFEYLDSGGRTIRDPEILGRIRALAIPPAWTDVWICPDPLGHLQASGVDAAGRRQYLYHERWRAWRDRRKFLRMRSFARALPELREAVERELERHELDRDRILALAVRLLDRALFRVGSERYAERNGSHGLSTLLKEHVEISDGQVSFDFPAKSGLRRLVSVRDAQAKEILRHLKARRDGGDRLLAYRNGDGWREVGAEDINAYLRELAGDGFTAKDFRTWHATVLAALALAARVDPDSPLTQRKRAVAAAVKEVAETLGNTPAVCRSSYVDPTVVDAFLEGRTIASRLAEIDRDDLDDPRIQAEVEAAVLELLTEGVEERQPAAA